MAESLSHPNIQGLADEPIEHHHEFVLLLSIQLDALSIRGPDSVVRVGKAVVETWAGQGWFRRAQPRAIGSQ